MHRSRPQGPRRAGRCSIVTFVALVWLPRALNSSARRLHVLAPTVTPLLITALLLAALVGTTAVPSAAAAPKTPNFGPAIEGYPRYEVEDGCDPTEKPGAQQMRDLLLATYGSAWTNIVRKCSPADSGHEEGRSVDWSRDVDVPAQKAQVDDFLTWLLATDAHGNKHAMARRMGVQYVMWNGLIWGAYSPSKGWQPQKSGDCSASTSSDTFCHRDHVHISLTWDGAWAKTSFYTGEVAACLSGAGCPVSRLSGDDRYATSVAIGRAAYPSSSTVVIASGENEHLVDGLVAGPLARRLSAPVLLVPGSAVPAVVTRELTRRGARTAVLVGGEAVLDKDVVQDLRDAGITTVDRVAGADRYATAAKVAERVGGDSAVVASGNDANLVDALGAGGAAARHGMPILLTAGTELPGATKGALRGRTSVVVAGGLSAVGPRVYDQLPSPTRVGGADRYATSAALATHFARTVDADTVSVASGADANLVDALPGAALGRLTLLTAPTRLPAPTRAFLTGPASVQEAVALGGPGAISDSVLRTVSSELGG